MVGTFREVFFYGWCATAIGICLLIHVTEGGGIGFGSNGVLTKQNRVAAYVDLDRWSVSKLSSVSAFHSLLLVLVVASAIQRLVLQQHLTSRLSVHAATTTMVSLGDSVVDLAWPVIRMINDDPQGEGDPFDGKFCIDDCLTQTMLQRIAAQDDIVPYKSKCANDRFQLQTSCANSAPIVL